MILFCVKIVKRQSFDVEMYCLWSKAPNQSKNMMYFKKHLTKDRIVLAVCDEELIGKKFSEGDITLDQNNCFFIKKLIKIIFI